MPEMYDRFVPSLKRLLPQATLDGLGRGVGFIQRLRAIRASVFVWSVVLSRFGAGLPGFAQARHWYERLCGRRFLPRPFQLRFKSERAVRLFERAFDSATRAWRNPRPHRPNHPLAKHFDDIVAVDSTIIPVADELSDVYTGSRSTPAALKACVAVSLFGLLPLWGKIVGANTHDMVLFPPLKWFRRRTLFLFDRGFGKHDRLRDLKKAGLRYLCPQRQNGVARVVGARLCSAKMRRALRNGYVDLRAFLPKEKRIRRIWDLDVEIRGSEDPHFRAPIRTRLVVIPGPKGQQRGLLTNLPSEEWSPDNIRELYRLRWQIELVFKELKQDLALRSMPSKDPHAVRVFAWASLIALSLSRTVTGWLYPKMTAVGLKQPIRPMLVSRALRNSIHLLAHLLRYPRRRHRDLLRLLRDMLSSEISAPSRARRDSFARLEPAVPSPSPA